MSSEYCPFVSCRSQGNFTQADRAIAINVKKKRNGRFSFELATKKQAVLSALAIEQAKAVGK